MFKTKKQNMSCIAGHIFDADKPKYVSKNPIFKEKACGHFQGVSVSLNQEAHVQRLRNIHHLYWSSLDLAIIILVSFLGS